jgi:hypothetical protein
MSAAHRGARLWLLVLLFLLSLPAVTTRIYASDEAQYFAYLRSLWFDRDVSFENEYRYFYERGVVGGEGFRETFLERRTDTGRRLNFGTIGCAILWSPFYAVAHLVTRLQGTSTDAPEADGFGEPYVRAVAYGSAVYGLLALLISARMADSWFGYGARAALVIWLGTPLVFYMYVAPPMSHACSAFAVTAFLATWLRVRRRWSGPGLAALGALAALMAMVREQDAFFVIGPVVDFARDWVGRRKAGLVSDEQTVRPSPAGMLQHAALGGVVAAAVYLPQALSYVSLNGRLGPSPLVSRKMIWWAPHSLEVLGSPEHGFFVWTPVALLALGALGAVTLGAGAPIRRDARWIAGCALLMVAVQVYVAGSVESWTVAGAFGQRRFVAVTPILVLGVAALWRLARLSPLRWVSTAAIALCVWWNVALVVQFGAGMMDRQRLEPARNAYVAFVVLPRQLPHLLNRYLFARKSFYQRSGR